MCSAAFVGSAHHTFNIVVGPVRKRVRPRLVRLVRLPLPLPLRELLQDLLEHLGRIILASALGALAALAALLLLHLPNHLHDRGFHRGWYHHDGDRTVIIRRHHDWDD